MFYFVSKTLEMSPTDQLVLQHFESERKLNLLKYLGLFSRRDAIPDQYYEDPVDLETVPQ